MTAAERTEPTDPGGTGHIDSAGDRMYRDLGTGAGLMVLILLLRLLAVSDWDWRTATLIMAVTDVNDAVTVALGTVMADAAFTGVAVAVLLPLAALRVLWPITPGRSVRLGEVLLFALTAAACLALTTTFRFYWVPVAAAVVAAAVVAARLFWKRGTGRRAVVFAFRRIGTIATVALLALAVLVRTPWAPEETITVRTPDGPRQVHGYVISDDPGFLTVLTEPDRTVETLTIADVDSRK